MCEERRQTILMVDDRRENLLVLKKILSSIEVDIVTVMSGEEALTKIEEQEFDLVLLDIMMPGIDGLETADRIRSNPVYEHVPFLFITSIEPEHTRIFDVYNSGAVDCIFRNVSPKILRAKVRNFLELSRHRRSMAESSRKLKMAEQSGLEYIEQLEELVQRTNQMTLDSEVAGIMHRQIFNNSSEAMWVLDSDFVVERMNKAFSKLLGVKEEDAIGRKCFELLNCPLADGSDCLMGRIMSGESNIECDIEHIGPGGEKGYYIVNSTALGGLGGGMAGIVESYKDITERNLARMELAEANKRLLETSITDGLTGIANRRHFSNSIEKEWKRLIRERSPLAVIMGDVDFFKLYNDTYGHGAGDDCLILVAQTLKGCVRRAADLVARYGGEEFVALLPGTTVEGALRVAEEILEKIRAEDITHSASQVSDHVTLSLGIAVMIPNQDSSYEELTKSADKALYVAKRSGRDRVVVYSEDMVGATIS